MDLVLCSLAEVKRYCLLKTRACIILWWGFALSIFTTPREGKPIRTVFQWDIAVVSAVLNVVMFALQVYWSGGRVYKIKELEDRLYWSKLNLNKCNRILGWMLLRAVHRKREMDIGSFWKHWKIGISDTSTSAPASYLLPNEQDICLETKSTTEFLMSRFL